MKLKILWPGKTRNPAMKEIQDFYLKKINKLENCRLIETKEARGLPEHAEEKILAKEALGLEKHLKDDYIVCLFDRGKQMNSEEFAQFLQEMGSKSSRVTFIVGGFLGLADGILKKAHVLLSLSKMTFSHELTRIVLLEQIYRSLTILHGRPYAK